MSVQKFIVTNQVSNFTTFPNNVLQKFKHCEALGVWTYLASLPPNWEFYKHQIKEHFGMGREKLSKILHILIKHNLIHINQVRAQNGLFSHAILDVQNGENFIENPSREEQNNKEINMLKPNTEKPSTDAQPLTGITMYGKPVTGFDTPINNIYKNNINKKIKYSYASDDARENSDIYFFEEFWKIYPKKKDKKRALDVWKRKKCDEKITLIMKYVRNSILNDAHWQDKQFIPYPSTILFNERWEDEITENSDIRSKRDLTPAVIKYFEPGNPDYDRIYGSENY